MAEPHPGFDDLLDRYLTGRLTEEEAGRLLTLLELHPDLGAELLDQLATDALLRDLAGKPAAQRWESRSTQTVGNLPRSRRVPWFVAGLAVAASLVLLLTRSQESPVPPDRPTATEEPTTAAVAVLTRTVGADWAEPVGGPTAGTVLEPGRLRLERGLAEIEFFSGARVVLEGPVEVQLVTADRVVCRGGRLTAEVPSHAAGFSIETPQGAVVDRGTAFGLSVSPGGTEVHVFQGKVELHGDTGRRDLAGGEGLAVAPGQADRRMPADPTGFVTRPELDRREDEVARRDRERWSVAGKAWNAIPGLLARFDFEGPAPERTLRNVAADRTRVGEGTVVGCSHAEGRWPGKGALEFSRVGDRVRLAIPGEFRSLTLMARVRVSGLDRRYNSLLMSDAFDPGAVHWQVLTDGRVRLGVANRPHHADYDSPRVFTPDRFGRWVHLAVVYNADTRSVTHYADGVRLESRPLKSETPLRPGRAELGNWNPATRPDSVPIRHFSGRMDEFCILARPLSDDDIRRHSVGEPPAP